MRNLIESEYFAECVERLGGHRAVDEALEPIIDGLTNDPYGFEKFENDFCSFRYARTRQIEGYIPPFVVVFTINEDKNVFLEWIDEIDEGEA
jgi:hypothetical protein